MSLNPNKQHIMSTYPIDDTEFEEVTIKSVKGQELTRADGWMFCLPDGSDVVALQGMTARFYGKGIGFPVRGLFIDGCRVFYRTAAEDERHQLVERFGATAADWLAKWDSGYPCWSVEMGGLGPSYEQCIQITAAEILRFMLDKKLDAATWGGERGTWRDDEKVISAALFEVPAVKALGLSGAQWGAACSLAATLYRRGPIDALSDPAINDRLIQVCKVFP